MAEQDSLNALNSKLLSAHRGVDPNRISAALLISWGQTKILLAGDAICDGSDSFQGWNGLQFPIGKVHVAKVPHHASAGAYAEALWSQMKPELAIVTCVQHANDPQPPRPEMLMTLLGHSARLALTSHPKWWTSTPHALVAGPKEWTPTKPSTKTRSSIPGAISARPASAENKHENAVVVRLDESGQILRIALHGEARTLSRKPT